MATIRDVAKAAGVSVATVSRVLNQSGYVKAETERKVRKAIQELNFETNEVARGLASKRTNTIALILPSITNPFFAEIARAVEDKARTYRYTVILCNTDLEDEREISYVEILKRRYTDGVIFASNMAGRATHQFLTQNNIPRVVLDRTLPDDKSSSVSSNNFEGARLAVEHLLAIGCRRIAHIAGTPELKTGSDRASGYRSVLQPMPWFDDSWIVNGDFTMQSGVRAVRELLQRHPDVDGIFAGNDMMAIGALKALKQEGIRVPDQVAIVGFDGIELTTMTEPEITTVAQPIYQLGTLAVDILMRKINGQESAEIRYELDTTLIQRKSTDRS